MYMMKICGSIYLPLITAGIVLLSVYGLAQSPQSHAEAESKSLIALSSALQRLDCQAVIEYSGRCFKPSVIIASSIQLVASASDDRDPSIALQHLLSRDRRFTNVAKEDGVFIIAQTRIPQFLLKVRIREIALTEQQRYEPSDAMRAVLSAPEVQAYMKAHNISVANDWGGFVAGPGSGRPHLDPKMEGVTVMDAIKTILKTFPAYTHLAVYRECSSSGGGKMISIDFK